MKTPNEVSTLLAGEIVHVSLTLGAAYLAGLAVGIWKSQEELESFWKSERVFEPRMNEDQRHTLYADWKKAVARSRA